MTERNPYELAHLAGVSDPDLIAENYRSEALKSVIGLLGQNKLTIVPTEALRCALEIAAGRDLDELESPGAAWLRQVATATAELIEEHNEAQEGPYDLQDHISLLADSLVPIYTGDRWRIFVDLGAWAYDTELESVPDMTEQAGRVLYEIAENLASKLIEAEMAR